nr:lipase 2 [Quercus suber]
MLRIMSERPIKLVTLGSSFAAGPGIDPIVDKAAMRSGRNYAHLLATKLQSELIDLTVSGATLNNVLNEKQSFSGKSFEPQLDCVPSDANIVTLTAGGNDLGYAKGMILDSLLAYTGPLRGILGRQLGYHRPELDEDELKERFILVIDRIREIAPHAKIYLVEYLSVFGDDSRSGQGIPISQHQIQRYRDLEAVLIRAYGAAAQARPDVALITMSKLSQNHVVGSTDPWMHGFTLSMFLAGTMPYHPNLAGHEAIANALYEHIRNQSYDQGCA